MCKAMEDMRSEAVFSDRVQRALDMLRDGMNYELVAKYSGLSLQQVKELDEKNSV